MDESSADVIDGRTIVAAVDGSAASDAALDWAIAEAKASGRHLLLVYVLTIPDELATSLLPLAGAPDASTFGPEVLKRAAAACEDAGVPHSSRLVEGTTSEKLVEISAEAAMLVLGGEEHHRLPPPGSDSVLQTCLRRCRCPLVLVKLRKHPNRS